MNLLSKVGMRSEDFCGWDQTMAQTDLACMMAEMSEEECRGIELMWWGIGSA